MIKHYKSEDEFISDFGPETYMNIVKETWMAIKNKNHDPNELVWFILCAFHSEVVKTNQKITIIIEATATKVEGGYRVLILSKINVSDEKCPDELLDRMNEIRPILNNVK
jgi:hypothetical protein